ncbi:MAG: DUF1730 domain-containing protein [Phycisphaerales bacterium]|nr:DUF1730 domain-containing protein [Phycisphaerales bacterium]
MSGVTGQQEPSAGEPVPNQRIVEQCLAEGFSAAAVCDARPSEFENELREWIGQGKHADMEWIADSIHARLDSACLVANARSIICVAERYHDGTADARSDQRGRVARYARGPDYHRRMKRRLGRVSKKLADEYPQYEFRPCADIEPIMEREYAERSGLARIGKNTLAIVEGQGSWVMLAEIVTSLPIAPTANYQPRTRLPKANHSVSAAPSGRAHSFGGDPCGSCTLCIDACPTGAIEPWTVDARRCISYLNLEHRGTIDRDLHHGNGDWLMGCDICQEVCPHNQPTLRSKRLGYHADFDGRSASFDLLEVLDWTQERRHAAFQHSTLKRVPLEAVRRSAVVCMGVVMRRAADTQGMRARLESIAADEAENVGVRQAATDALSIATA